MKPVDVMSHPVSETGARDGGVERALRDYMGAFHGVGGDLIEALTGRGRGRGVAAGLYRAPPFEVSVPALPVSRVSFTLTRARVGCAMLGDRLRYCDASRFAAFLTPGDVPMVFRKDVPSRHINIYFQADSFDDSELLAPLAPLQPLTNVAVPGVRSLLDQLVDELQHPAMRNADAADCLARLVLVSLARHLRGARPVSQSLSAPVLAKVRDYVMAHLGQRILVADMALQAQLSPDRFAFIYKQQTGQTPHQLVMALRLEHAAELLRHSDLSLAEVAGHCGFSSQQHLTNVMHKQLGVTPGRYRTSKRLPPPA